VVTIGQTAAFLALMMMLLKEADDMKPSTQDQAEGKFHEVKGTIKEKLGKATKNRNIENGGANERAAGKVQNKVGQVEKVLGV
jgi:uncharacterized protein YjbJ (UPF0337 family)